MVPARGGRWKDWSWKKVEPRATISRLPVLYNCTLYCRTGGNCCRILDFGKKLTALKRNSYVTFFWLEDGTKERRKSIHKIHNLQFLTKTMVGDIYCNDYYDWRRKDMIWQFSVQDYHRPRQSIGLPNHSSHNGFVFAFFRPFSCKSHHLTFQQRLVQYI